MQELRQVNYEQLPRDEIVKRCKNNGL